MDFYKKFYIFCIAQNIDTALFITKLNFSLCISCFTQCGPSRIKSPVHLSLLDCDVRSEKILFCRLQMLFYWKIFPF